MRRFDDTNPLWAGTESVFGFLRVPPTEIGIHRIGLRVTRIANSSFSALDVYKLPLGTDGDGLDLDSPLMASQPVSQWVPGVVARIREDSQANLVRDGYYGGFMASSQSATCPLRRFAFYSSSRASFAPTMPSPQRAYHLFGNITGRAYAHPTMNQVSDGAFLGQYASANGFCFCPLVQGVPQAHCQIRIGASIDPSGCSLSQTVESLMGGTPRASYVFPPLTSAKQIKVCQMQLDWPKIPVTLRDGSPGPSDDSDFRLASDTSNRKCHVLDRLSPFQYKYTSVPEFPSPGPDSYLGGACQTRRAARLPGAAQAIPGGGRCVRDSLQADRSLIRCTGVSGATVLERPSPLTPRAVANRTAKARRTRCGACARPPRFTTEGGAPLPRAESSFGRPFRLSAERMMAKDLRDAVCAGDPDCPVLNRSAWRAGEFMRNFLLSPARLFVGANATPPGASAKDADDSGRWTDHGWVYCPDRTSLKTGKGCRGSIPRALWQKSKTRVCPHMVRAMSSNGSQGGLSVTPFFDIDNYTQAVHEAYAQAMRLVMQANCIAAGNFTCLPKPWVYHPASFVPSNQEWAYKTVLDYYRTISPPTCPLTSDELGLMAYNQRFMQDCPANSMRFFEDILKIVRLVGTEVVLVLSTLCSMGFKLLVLFFSGLDSGLKASVRQAQQQIAADWQWVKVEAKSMLAGVNKLLMDMVFTTGEIGRGLLAFLTSVCGFVNEYYAWFIGVWCNYIHKYLVRFLTVLRKGMSMIAGGFEVLQDFMDVVFQGVLPAAFISKYGDKMFQSQLIEKYSQPTSRKSRYMSRVQNSMRIYSSSFSRGTKATLNFAKGLGFVGAALSAAMTAYDTYNDIQGALNYPENFTLFDFSGVFDAIDVFTEFLVNDETCFVYGVLANNQLSVRLFQCFNNSLANQDLANLAATTLAPTMCWANAQTSLGQSNLFSCHSGSTCCPDNECAEPVVCNNCPAPKFEGQARYACNTLTQQCQCAVLLETYTPCTSNQQCGATSQCILASLSSTVSYGTIPCGQCQTNNVYCNIPPVGYPGQCTCYTDNLMPKVSVLYPSPV